MATAANRHEPAARGGVSRGLLLAALICIAVEPTVGQELRARSDTAAVATQPLGMTGWRRDPVAVTTPKLGMTGWRREPVAVTTPKLGMTGWHSEPVAVTTPKLGMTGWRSGPVVGGKLVCLGGTTASLATREAAPEYSCQCPKGRTAQAVGPSYQNTFQCILVAVSPPTQPGVPSREAAKPRSVAPLPKTICMGGQVSRGRCECARGFKLVQAGANAFRCVRPVTLPKPELLPKFGPPVAGGKASPRGGPASRAVRTR
jgi:hypothetical protein